MSFLQNIIAGVLGLVDTMMATFVTVTPLSDPTGCGVGAANVTVTPCGESLAAGMAQIVSAGVSMTAGIIQALGAGSY